MKANKLSVAIGYLLLIILLVVAANTALRQAGRGQAVYRLFTAQPRTPTLIGAGSQTRAERLTPVEIRKEPQAIPAQEETTSVSGISPTDMYPLPMQAGAVPPPTLGGTPYPGPTQPISIPTVGLLAYPGPGTETPSVTEVPQQIQATLPAAITSTPEIQPSPTPLNVQNQTVLAPTIVPTLSIVRTEIQVSDPKGFQVVSGKVQFMEIFAYWSPVSKSMAPVINMLADRYGDRINFVFLDIDAPENGLYKQLLGNRLPPIFFLIDPQGGILKVWEGYVQQVDLENALKPYAP